MTALEELADNFTRQLQHTFAEGDIRDFVAREAAALDPETQERLTAMIRERKPPFTWGEVIKIHEVGDHYQIIEYIRHRPGNAGATWEPKVSFHVNIRQRPDEAFRDTNHSYGSLDAALVACVAQRHNELNRGTNDAANSQAAQLFMRMIGPL